MKWCFIILFSAFTFFAVQEGKAFDNPSHQITVGSETGYPPYAIVTKDGQADGFSVDLMKAVCEAMEIDVTFRVGPWSEVRKALEDGEIDALPLVSYSKEREKVFDFTAPHTITHGVVFKRKETPDIEIARDLRDKAIIVMRSDAGHDWLVRNDTTDNLTLTKTVSEALLLLASGQKDYALAPHLVGLLTVKELELSNIEVTGPLFDAYGRGFGFAVQEGNIDLLTHLNEGLNIIKETGRYDEIYDKWFGGIAPKGASPEVIARYLAWGAIGAIILIAFPVGWSLTLRRKVRQRTVELNLEVAEHKQAEADLRETTIKLEEANHAKSEFMATMSHEFRTPLNAILGFSEMLRSQYFGPLGSKNYGEYADDIHLSGEQLLSLVNDMLDIAAIEAGKRDINKEDVDTCQVIKECIKSVKPAADKEGISLTLNFCDNLPRVFADRRSVVQIVLNILSNAVKFSNPNGTITIHADTQDKNVIIKVIDTGAGISADDLSSITDPFNHSSSDPYHTKDGAGLGLSIVKSLIDLHKGTLMIESEIDVGTTVTLTFPIEGNDIRE